MHTIECSVSISHKSWYVSATCCIERDFSLRRLYVFVDNSWLTTMYAAINDHGLDTLSFIVGNNIFHHIYLVRMLLCRTMSTVPTVSEISPKAGKLLNEWTYIDVVLVLCVHSRSWRSWLSTVFSLLLPFYYLP